MWQELLSLVMVLSTQITSYKETSERVSGTLLYRAG
jgi:hypothetical protein